MIAMLNITLPAKGFVALRNALGEAPAIAISQALDEAQVRGEAELAAKILAESEARLRQASAASDAKLERSRAEFQQVHRELREQIAQLPNREELKRFATHADLAELRAHVLRLDKKMTVGFLALSALQLAPNAPLFLEWGAKMVGYALK